MQIKASLNHLHIAPRKVRLVAGLVRGCDLPTAELELKNLPKRSAQPLLKLLQSALANAKHNFQQEDPGNLFIKDLIVNPGPMLKRFRPRAFGRAAMIRKRTSHVSLILETKKFSAPKIFKKTSPVVIDAVREDVAEVEKKKKTPTTISIPEKAKKATKSKGFMKRMFRRKAI